MKNKILIFFLALFLISAEAAAQTQLPQYTGRVNDFAGILSGQDKSKLESLLYTLENKTTAQIAVVTVYTVYPLDIETYAVELFAKWGIGQKGKDNGVLFLIAVKDKKLRIEVGYGLEGAIPDAMANQVISMVVVPAFKQGDYAKGVWEGTLAISKLVADEYDVELTELQALPEAVLSATREVTPLAGALRLLGSLVFFLLIFGLRSGMLWWFILTPGTRRRRGGYWHGGGYGGSSGGFGGGFGGFGGGMSGGGGASGGW